MMELLFFSWFCKGLNLLDMFIWNVVFFFFIWRYLWDIYVVFCFMFVMLLNVLRWMFVFFIMYIYIFLYLLKFFVDVNIVNLIYCDMVKGFWSDFVDLFVRKDVFFYYNWLRKYGFVNILLFLFMWFWICVFLLRIFIFFFFV